MKSMPPIRSSAVKLVAIGAILTLCAVILFYGYTTESPLPPVPEDARYKDSSVPVEARVDDLLRYMTLEEKIGQMALVDKGSVQKRSDVSSYGLGGLLSGAGAKPDDNTVDGWTAMVSQYREESLQTRLRIPILYGIDANHGHSNLPGATVFPHFIGLGASGNPQLVKNIAVATAQELVATGIRWSYSPTLDLPKDIRWGRVYEAFSDDPELTAALGAAYVEGLQTVPEDSTSSKLFVLSTLKHYIGAGSMLWGSSSNKDFFIDQGTTPADMEALASTYLPPFKAAINAGAGSVMVGLNSWGDTKLSANAFLIQETLKDELGFEGFVVSDWYGVYEIPGGKYRAAVKAINAGIDMVMLPFEYKEFVSNVVRAVEKGEIKEARIDDAVRRILKAKFALGLFDEERKGDQSSVGSEAHRNLARDAVAQSLVLLKNEGGILPLHESALHIQVAGSAADNAGKQMGAWTIEWQGVDGNWISGATSILKGITEAAGDDALVEYAQDGSFPDGQKADIGIAIVGETPYAEGWGDASEPSLSEEDILAIKNLSQSAEKVVVVIVAGRPLFVADQLPQWDALVMAWLPGSEGQGVADVLFGNEPFSGKLPLPWPKNTLQLPIGHNDATADGTDVLFPRYFGLK